MTLSPVPSPPYCRSRPHRGRPCGNAGGEAELVTPVELRFLCRPSYRIQRTYPRIQHIPLISIERPDPLRPHSMQQLFPVVSGSVSHIGQLAAFACLAGLAVRTAGITGARSGDSPGTTSAAARLFSDLQSDGSRATRLRPNSS